MLQQQAKYELLKEQDNFRQKHKCIQICLLVALCLVPSIAVYATWTVIYKTNLNIPPKLIDIPEFWSNRASTYSQHFHKKHTPNNPISLIEQKVHQQEIKHIENETIFPSKKGHFINPSADETFKLVCYYASPKELNITEELYPKQLDANLCTHINIGFVTVENSVVQIDDKLDELLRQATLLKSRNKNLKILLWVGGAFSTGFSDMVKNHSNRKLFIQSVKLALETYRLDGLDLDWEFPNGFTKERMHFSQLLHEIRREYQREHRTYLLTIAVAAPQSIVDTSYDVQEINSYADFVNIMTYDYHFYTKTTPFTGLNSPLYKRHDEGGIFAGLNINFTAYYWHSQGLDKNKIVIGLPTYGHSFTLVNPFNAQLMSPSSGFGSVGANGFTTYADICWVKKNNIYVTSVYDVETCSPYLYSGTEWISYEDERSLECKTNYIKENGFGGAMIFSLNTDDYSSVCDNEFSSQNEKFPLVRKINSVLFKP